MRLFKLIYNGKVILMAKKANSLAHTKWMCKYHIVFTPKYNFGEHIVLGDINEIPLEEIPDCDVLIGGFPCQPFSMMGQQKGFEDTRGTLFFRIAEIVNDKIEKGKKPKAIILENVRSLRTHNNGKTYKQIHRVLQDVLGYKVFCEILNSADYGVPQTRNRTYIVYFDNQVAEYEFPMKQELNKTLQDLIEHDPQKMLRDIKRPVSQISLAA